jgi:hypothetical protein
VHPSEGERRLRPFPGQHVHAGARSPGLHEAEDVAPGCMPPRRRGGAGSTCLSPSDH